MPASGLGGAGRRGLADLRGERRALVGLASAPAGLAADLGALLVADELEDAEGGGVAEAAVAELDNAV